MFDERNYFKPNLKRSLQGAIVCLIEQQGFILIIKNAKEKDDCENNRLFLSGLSKKDVFANSYGGFEPTKYNFFIVHKLIICVFGIYTIRLFCYNTQVYLVFHLYLFHHTNHDAR